MAMNGRGPLEFYKDQREPVAEMLRYGMSSREVSKVTGIPYRTICRFGHYLGLDRYAYSPDTRIRDPRALIVRDVTTDSAQALTDAAHALEAAFRHYENYGGRVAYDAWQKALQRYNGLHRESARTAEPSSRP